MIAKLNGAPSVAAKNQFRKDKGMKHPFKHNKLRGAQRDRFKFCLGLVNDNYVNISARYTYNAVDDAAENIVPIIA